MEDIEDCELLARTTDCVSLSSVECVKAVTYPSTWYVSPFLTTLMSEAAILEVDILGDIQLMLTFCHFRHLSPAL